MTSRSLLSQVRRTQIAQRGYSLVELSISLAIIAAVIVGSLVGVQRIMANNRANTVLSEVPRISAALLGMLGSSSNTSMDGITTKEAAQLGVFNSESIVKDAQGAFQSVNNAFGGRYLVASAGFASGFGTAADRAVVIKITGVPGSMCGTVVSGLSTVANALWVDTSVVDAKIATKPLAAAIVKDFQPGSALKLGEVAKLCDGDGKTINAYFPAM